jgi:hypothetical protein
LAFRQSEATNVVSPITWSKLVVQSVRHQVARLAVLLLYVLASTTVGFAHRAHTIAIPAELAQFALPDGTLPIICSQTGTQDQGKEGAHTPFCEACCLTAAPGLLFPLTVGLPQRLATKRAFWVPSQEFEQSFWTVVALGARGPPAA